MCTETFLRLPEEKRGRFLDAAWAEFTAVPFARASINQIIRRAGIPRGSFYQYFTDKSDLFSYLMEDVRGQILEEVREILERARGDIFRTAVVIYDSFLDQLRQGPHPVMDRMISVMRINPKIDLDRMVVSNPEEVMELYAGAVDAGRFRRQDRAFLLQVCCLTAFSLVGTVLATLEHPERGERNREELMEKLEILQWGCVKTEETEGGMEP